MENAFGTGKEQFINNFIINPDMVGGLLFSKKNDNLRTGYAIATKVLAANNFFKQIEIRRPNQPIFIGDFDLSSKTQETWFNMANSYKMNDHLALGLTFIVAARSENYSNGLSAKRIPIEANQEISRFDSRTLYNFWNVKGLIRLGVAADYINFRLGANLILPSINIMGTGNVKREIAIINNDGDGSNAPEDAIILNSDEDLKTKHKYPLSAGLGASLKLKNNDWLHFSTEMFAPINTYSIFSSSSTPLTYPQGSADSLPKEFYNPDDFLKLLEQAKFVINFSVGYESYISDNWGVLAGFRTDFNSGDQNETYNISIIERYSSNADRYHFSGGVWTNYKNKKFTAGLEVGLAPKATIRQLADFSNEAPSLPIAGAPDSNATLRGVSFRLFLGVEIMFTDDNTVNLSQKWL